MKKLVSIFLLSITIINFSYAQTTYYVAPPGAGGSNSNNGTSILTPFATWEKLSGTMVAGDIALIRGGTYTSSTPSDDLFCNWDNLNGTAGNYIKIWAYPGEFPVFNLSSITPTNPNPTAVRLNNSEYVHIRGLRITGLKQHTGGTGISRGFHVENSNNCIIEEVEIDHIGGYGVYLRNGANNNTFLQMDIHHLDDRFSSGTGAWGNANGVDCSGGVNATGNTFDQLRIWWCSDDGFDFYNTNGVQTIKNCWAFWNGYEPGTFTGRGDGDGFKLGPENTSALGSNLRTVTNCLSFENRKHGYNQNVGRLGVTLYNNIAYKNGVVDGLEDPRGFKWGWTSPAPTCTSKNNIAYANRDGTYTGTEIAGSFNSWNGGVTVSNADFVSVSSVGVDGPRGSDGSLPNLSFLKLAAGSDLINAGTNVGLPANGVPDMGPFEFAVGDTVDLIIIQGESNAGGRAPNTSATSGELAVRTAVKILNNNTLTFQSIDVGTNNNLGQNNGATTTEHGLELGLTNEVEAGNLCSSPVYLVKCGKSGAKIEEFINGHASGYWTEEKARIDAAIAYLNTNSLPYRITVLQSIGLNDYVQYDGNGAYPNAWKTTMATYRSQFRTRYGANIPFINTLFLTGTNISAPWNTAIQEVATADSKGSTVSAVGATLIGSGDVSHWNYAGLKTMATRLVAAMNTYWGECGVEPENAAPTSIAGTDIITTNSIVRLTGSGTDPDGTVNSYFWTKVSGGGGTIVTPSAATTDVTGLSVGIYDFQLLVADNDGATSTDIVRVTVKAVSTGGGTDTITSSIKFMNAVLVRPWFWQYVDITWEGSFKNCKTLNIERRLNGGAFSSIETITVSNPNKATYRASDLSPKKGMNGYRIKWTDKNNKFGYSPLPIKEVKKIDVGSIEPKHIDHAIV